MRTFGVRGKVPHGFHDWAWSHAEEGTTYSAHVPGAGKLSGRADSNWGVTRSTTGYVIKFCGAAVMCRSSRQHCITMSSCEAELIALCELAIELYHLIQLFSPPYAIQLIGRRGTQQQL